MRAHMEDQGRLIDCCVEKELELCSGHYQQELRSMFTKKLNDRRLAAGLARCTHIALAIISRNSDLCITRRLIDRRRLTAELARCTYQGSKKANWSLIRVMGTDSWGRPLSTKSCDLRIASRFNWSPAHRWTCSKRIGVMGNGRSRRPSWTRIATYSSLGSTPCTYTWIALHG
jgi:hypothetical protein